MPTTGNGGNVPNTLATPGPPVDDVPASGQVPASVLINGSQTRIPRWPIYANAPGEVDRLTVSWRRDGVTTTVYDQDLQGPITETEFVIPLPVPLWAGDGVASLSYEVEPIVPAGNGFTSLDTDLYIDHSVIPLPELLEAVFPNANLYGYLNCSTVPPIWDGVSIKIPYQGFQDGDECVLTWRAYTTLNAAPGSYIDGTEGIFTHRLTRAEAEDADGFVLPAIPFATYVEPLLYGSGSAQYKIRRAGNFIGESKMNRVKVDRYRPGETEPCGP
ncbi:hypothetical protein HNO91_08055 [Pseudomonas corrugata]|uniref:Uncharacterized protein n=1 Tax=Pseudomonas corrugata TaxID=47879 RepID=A0A7Y5Z3J6_9PSED|nr:hypothetical protein [Pseudomonas corrugata]NUT86370.1 hypothetical protein [Pseudomonas corrugata]